MSWVRERYAERPDADPDALRVLDCIDRNTEVDPIILTGRLPEFTGLTRAIFRYLRQREISEAGQRRVASELARWLEEGTFIQ